MSICMKKVCIMSEIKEDNEWQKKYKKEHHDKQQAELETSLVKAIGINSPEMRAMKTKLSETEVIFGCPDLLGYNTSSHFFTVELKVARSNKVRFSPHQISFHKSHPKNTFILIRALGPRSLKLVPGSMIHELLSKGHGPWDSVDWIFIQKSFESA
jgi:hypothetical protein